uniref:Proteasomal ATPase second OB domain-containing protein n=1 Tax=Cucumis sativus TaxID=3659 RepID=A0A0A0K9W2_CUCSA
MRSWHPTPDGHPTRPSASSEEKNEEDRYKVDDPRGSPMSVGNLEEPIDENHAIVSSFVGLKYYVGILLFVDKDQLELGCAILMHNNVGFVIVVNLANASFL